MPNTNYILTSDGNFISEEELYHHGVKGQKWGVRRYQNEDGSLTEAGKKKYLTKGREVYDKFLDRTRKRNKRQHNWQRFRNMTDPTYPGEGLDKIVSVEKNYKRSDVNLAWKQAKNKAKMDSSYKQSAEYKKAKQEWSRLATEETLERLIKGEVIKN